MALAATANNYLYGAGKMYFKQYGDTAYLELGNFPTFEIMMEPEERVEHWESQTSQKLKDVDDILKWSCKASLTLEEFSADNLNIAFRGDDVQSLGNQAAGALSDSSTTTQDDLYVDLGYTDLSYVKLSHGAITNSPFVDKENVTGTTSSAVGVIVSRIWTGYLLVIMTSGTFVVGETITGAGGASATTTAVETFPGAVVADLAEATKIFTEGTDYDIDPIGGLIRELSGGSIAAHTCFVSANYAAKTNKSVRALAGTQIKGELLFIGNPRRGPRWRVQMWTCNINISGALALISSEPSQIPLEIIVLSDVDNHPTSPYFTATEAS